MKNILLKEELFAIFKNKKILIPIIAVMFVPVMYAGMFLWAFWDPYDKLTELPVAVVNEDAGATLDGDHLKLGDDLVSKLKKNKQFGFEFVDKKEGYDNLKDQKYYMVIEIPKDFSENATTLMDEKPKKLELIYTPNEGYNFLSAQIGGTAAEKIKTAVAEKVTETYAETIFEKINQLSDGVVKASDGAGKLSDGSEDLNKGSKDLNKGLATLAEKSIEFKDGMNTADAGSNKLASGSQELYNGLVTLAKKSIEFDNGMTTADSGANKLASGAKDLDNGLATMSKKSAEFNNGMKTADSGAKNVEKGSKSLNEGLGQLLGGHHQLETASMQLKDGGEQLQAGIQEAKTGIQTMNGELPKLVDGTEKIQTGAQDLSTKLSEWQEKSNGASAGADQLNQGIAALKDQLSQMMPLLDALPEDKKVELVKSLNDLEAGSAQLKVGTKGLSDAAGQLSAGAGQLSTKLADLNDGQKALQAGVSKLSDGSQLLEGGANKLVSGQDTFVSQMKLFGEKFTEAKAGGDQLASGSSVLANGMKQLTDGSNALNEGTGQLATGSSTLKTGAYDLLTGMNQLAAGSDALSTGAGKLASGSNDLKNGASDLSNGMNQLTAGASAITSGTGQLADGSVQLKDGTTKLADGAKELADKLSDGANEASKVHADDKTFNMISKPVKLDSENINHVPNYGTGFAPYFLSLGLFVGALLLSIVFPLRDTAVVPSSGFNWFVSKFSIMAGVGIFQALLADIILLGGLGLDVQSVPKFILLSIITSLAFIALIQMLVSVFADAGRFIAIIVLILQLTTSAGTFPLELIPNFLQHFNAFLPMTYSVQGFKAVISSGDYSFMWQNIIILLSFFAAFALVTIAYFTMRHRHVTKHQSNHLVSE
ncbi:YhgE/Pip domain-containing protein [Neobacillus soli]|uniref:YhgE/Pip domain-containing protein n=1 Tax=Neobacillus soli TaxID=220688 RepID=UPI00082619D7|nr:YhgE/Pip domain-containing protein [Neobacillus soli]